MPNRSLYAPSPDPELEAALTEAANRRVVAHLIRAVLRKPIRSLEVMAALDDLAGAQRVRDLLLDAVRELEDVAHRIETGEEAAGV